MELRQREHIATVMRLAGEGLPLPPAQAPDPVIADSWARCVHQHGLDPTRMQEAIILPPHRVREHQERLDEFLRIARHGLEALYQQVAGMGYCVLLTDARGVTVDFIGDLQLDATLRKAGLYLGSDWSEHHAGTCGVGTAIATGQALTVHQGDHFDATHIPLTCTAAPVYDPLGRLNAILDISALTSPQAKSSQHLALQLVKVYAQRVENANFLRCFRHDWVLKLHPSPEFVEINPDHLVALDAHGRIVGHNRAAQLLLEGEHGSTVLGLPFEQLVNARLDDLGRFVRAMPGEHRAVTLARSGRVLFLHAVPPPSRWAHAAAVATPADPVVPAPLAQLSGGDPALDRQIQRAARLVDTPVSVLITGETGSGKEYFAKALHQASQRRGKPFVAVNCAAIPETLIESELFGHLPGSFSGARLKGKAGLIQEADGGTLFLDEIGDMPLPLQARLLRVLAEREVLPIGATRAVKVDVRVIAATHADLQALVRAGRFRDDLYYRLAGAHLVLPPLRQRRDLPWLVAKLLREGGRQVQLGPDAEHWLRAHDWPGNLRELRNVIDYASAMAGDGGVIGVADLPDGLLAAARAAPAPTTPAEPAAVPAEAQLLLQYLRAARWNVSAVAHQLGVARMTVYRRMKRWGITPPGYGDGDG
ncbi:sigma-54-dependent Fis family transcriptional regulator [Calidifontimicrobium sp. SYSU G02091]|uniref:sigma-54-dependent Fis family transcriptional regulator n=1 Tax=Calidifontimicrobium sp. SYSU G02091 TaxID=2926421 RepID=UPI001F5394AF|nr:sigma-54-dependent Fis family transcriptional regulator [Calidifontimicrobium sp. SYSU G02091]MCI1190655.1 sigma-54-dependent Fis family transcriptional regulator [Calidifontimicrobium sp. SYSU G02091]